MLYRRNEKAGRAARLQPPASSAGVSASILASVAPEGESDVLGVGPDQGSHLRPRLLDQLAGGAASLWTDEAIAGQPKRGIHSLAGFRTSAAALSHSSRSRPS